MEDILSEIPTLIPNLEAVANDLSPVLSGVVGFLYTWGWIILPFLLWPLFLSYWLHWRQHLWDVYERPESIILEVRPPGEIEKPIRAMESVLHGFWQIYGPPNWYEKWIEGEQGLSFSLEIAGIDGVPHFLIRLPKPYRDLFESHVYSQYGEAEINQVEDYVNQVPSNIPNERWDFLGCGYQMSEEDVFPIRTYKEFETEMEKSAEEKVDPLSGLMEGIAKLKEGEQIWIQIKAKPVSSDDYKDRVEAKRDEIMQRATEETPPRSVFEMVWEFINSGLISEREDEDEDGAFLPDQMLSPGERERLKAMERKASKKHFKCHIHHMYIARKEVMDKPKFKIPMSYFTNFSDEASNAILPNGDTITKPRQDPWNWFFMQERRRYLLKRKFLRNYVRRTPMFFPNIISENRFILNTEELATLFHFPDEETAPPSILERVESKKAEAPWELPT